MLAQPPPASPRVESGEKVVITRHAKPVTQITPAPPERREARFGTMKDRIKLLPGWDDPIRCRVDDPD